MERVCDSVLVLCAPDGVSVVGTIVVGASVGDDVVGASVGVAAAHTTASSSLQLLVGPHGEVPRVPPPAGAVRNGHSLVRARTARG